MDANPPIAVLIGPTGVGKTATSIRVARELDVEIISADSMSVYRGMDIGTDKPDLALRREIPHHMIDIVDPDEEFGAGAFQQHARAVIRGIAARGRLPFVVGGTALYVRALLYDYPLASVGSDEALRQRLREKECCEGRGTLHRMLAELDPVTADRLHPNDLRRIIRAVEVTHITGESMTTWRARTPDHPVYPCIVIGLWLPREKLYAQINQRVDRMFEEGLVEEFLKLQKRYRRLSRTAMQALGYREVNRYLKGCIDLDTCIALTKQHTRNFAKRQIAWFRKDPLLHWIHVESAEQRVPDMIQRWLESTEIG